MIARFDLAEENALRRHQGNGAADYEDDGRNDGIPISFPVAGAAGSVRGSKGPCDGAGGSDGQPGHEDILLAC
jgi:hypothetical protein